MKLIVFKLRYHVVYENGIRGGQTDMTVAAATAQEAEQLVCDEAVQEANVTEVNVISSETIATDVLVKSDAEIKHDLKESTLQAQYDKGYSDGIKWCRSVDQAIDNAKTPPPTPSDGGSVDPNVEAKAAGE